MTVDRDHLDRVLRAFDQEDWDEIHLVAGDFEVHLTTSVGDPNATNLLDNLWDKSEPQSPQARVAADTTAESSTSVAEPVAATEPVAVPAAGPLHDVVAPSPGIFWRSPRPGAPPFADVGDHVEPHSTLCIVEVMKLMNHVTAQVTGTVVAVLVGNGEQVDRGQPLFRIQLEET